VKRGILIVLVLGVLGAAAFLFIRHEGTQAKRGELILHGNVDIREVTLGFRVAGKLKEVLRDEGDPIKEGDTLARLDDAPYRREVDEAAASVASVSARLKLLEAGNRPQEIEQARAALNEQAVTATNTSRTFQRAQELYQNKTISVQERDDAEAREKEAQARVVSAREKLKLLEAGFRTEDIEQAKADLARAQATQASAEIKVRDTVMVSPSDGVILTRAQEPGAILQTGTPVFTLSLRNPVWVRAYISEPDLGRIHPGMKMTVFTDSRPNIPYLGQIGFISPRAEFTPKNVETTELRTSLVYRLRIVIENADEGLRQGMPVIVQPVGSPLAPPQSQ